MQTVSRHPVVTYAWNLAPRAPGRRAPFALLLACAAAAAVLLCIGAAAAAAAAAAVDTVPSAADPGTGPGSRGGGPPAAPPPSASASPSSPPPTWRLGGNLAAGDSYTYEICNSVHAYEATHPDPCYTLRMNFVHGMAHHAYGPVWIMDVGFGNRSTVMLLAHNTMTVHPTSAWDVWLADSIQDTVLHLAPYGEQSLQVGAHWGDIDAYFYSVPLSIVSRAGDRSVLGYDTTAESRTVIISSMPFPEYSRWHDPRSISGDPRIMHEYALVR